MIKKIQYQVLSAFLIFQTLPHAYCQEEDLEMSRPVRQERKKTGKPTESAFHPFMEFAGGSESNVFHSPGSAANRTGLIKDDSLLWLAAGFDWDGRWRRNHYWDLSYSYNTQRYSSHTSVNNWSHDIDLAYRYRFDRARDAGIKLGWGSDHITGTDIFGGKLLQEFSNRKMSVKPWYRYRWNLAGERKKGAGGSVWGPAQAKLSYVYESKDYKEPLPPTTSLDYKRHGVELNLEQKFLQKQNLLLGVEFYWRNYANDPAKLAQPSLGADNTRGTKRKQNYRIFSLGWERDLAEDGKVGLEYKRFSRIDPFQDYYTYTADIAAGVFKYRPIQPLFLKAGIEYESRDYKVQEAPVPGPNPKLEKEYLRFNFSAAYEVLSYWSLWLQYNRADRDTNKIQTSSTGREYLDNIILLGTTLHW